MPFAPIGDVREEDEFQGGNEGHLMDTGLWNALGGNAGFDDH